MYMRDGLHSTSIGYGAAVFGDELSAAVDSGMGSIQSTVAWVAYSRQWHG